MGKNDMRCACGAGDDRRGFLKQAAGLVAGAAVAAGAASGLAEALPWSFVAPLEAAGNELTYPVPDADGATVDRDNGVIVVRFQGKVFAFNLSCPHENAAVRWKPAVGRFECSRHDSKYTPNGTYTSGRATRNMDRFALKRNGNNLVVDVSKLIQSDAQKAQWEAAAVTL
jgi:nitrite reductase/ring-hydroxylating ferredoxin subunit